MHTRALSFQSEPLSTADMEHVLPLVARYNGFDSERMLDAVGQLRGEIAYYVFGRENSPVLHVHLPYWTHQQEKNCPESSCDTDRSGPKDSARRLEPGERAALRDRVQRVLTAAGATEVGPGTSDHIVRAWWD